MSKSTLGSLKYAIKTEDRVADEAKAELKNLDRAIYNAMDDRVGQSAKESAAGLLRSFTYMVDGVLSALSQAASSLDQGYDRLSGLSSQGDSLLSEANSIVSGVGDL